MIFKWIIVAFLTADALYYVSKAGKYRAPITGTDAALNTAIIGAYIAIIIIWWH